MAATIPPKPDPFGSPLRIPSVAPGSGLPPPVGMSLPAASPSIPGQVGTGVPAAASGFAYLKDKGATDQVKSRASLSTENVSATLLALSERHALENLPPWLRQCHDDALATPEWEALAKHLHALVLAEVPLYRAPGSTQEPRFSELSPEEQAVLVEDVYVRHIENAAGNRQATQRTANSTSGGETRRQGRQDKNVPLPREPEVQPDPAFPSFFARMQEILENGVIKEATKGRVGINSLCTLLDVSGAGVVSLFSSLSATSRHSLQQLMLNVDLPPPLRRTLWPAFLKHTDGREEYLTRSSTRWIDTVSKYDIKITQDAERLLFKTPHSPYADRGLSNSQLMLLKGAVSYYTVAVKQDLEPPDPYLIWLTVPIVLAYQPLMRVMDLSTMDMTVVRGNGSTSSLHSSNSNSNSKTTLAMHGPASTGPLPDIVEALLALTEMNGGLFRGERTAAVKDIIQHVNKMLQKHDNAMVRHILDLKRPDDAPPPPAGGGGVVLIVDEVLRFVLGPSLTCGLADILGPLACGFLWDQGVVFGFHVVLPPFIFTMLLALREKVMEARSWDELLDVVTHEAQHLPVGPFQRLMERYCVAKLRKDLKLPDPSPYLQVNVGRSARGNGTGAARMLNNILTKGAGAPLPIPAAAPSTQPPAPTTAGAKGAMPTAAAAKGAAPRAPDGDKPDNARPATIRSKAGPSGSPPVPPKLAIPATNAPGAAKPGDPKAGGKAPAPAASGAKGPGGPPARGAPRDGSGSESDLSDEEDMTGDDDDDDGYDVEDDDGPPPPRGPKDAVRGPPVKAPPDKAQAAPAKPSTSPTGDEKLGNKVAIKAPAGVAPAAVGPKNPTAASERSTTSTFFSRMAASAAIAKLLYRKDKDKDKDPPPLAPQPKPAPSTNAPANAPVNVPAKGPGAPAVAGGGKVPSPNALVNKPVGPPAAGPPPPPAGPPKPQAAGQAPPPQANKPGQGKGGRPGDKEDGSDDFSDEGDFSDEDEGSFSDEEDDGSFSDDDDDDDDTGKRPSVAPPAPGSSKKPPLPSEAKAGGPPAGGPVGKRTSVAMPLHPPSQDKDKDKDAGIPEDTTLAAIDPKALPVPSKPAANKASSPPSTSSAPAAKKSSVSAAPAPAPVPKNDPVLENTSQAALKPPPSVKPPTAAPSKPPAPSSANAAKRPSAATPPPAIATSALENTSEAAINRPSKASPSAAKPDKPASPKKGATPNPPSAAAKLFPAEKSETALSGPPLEDTSKAAISPTGAAAVRKQQVPDKDRDKDKDKKKDKAGGDKDKKKPAAPTPTSPSAKQPAATPSKKPSVAGGKPAPGKALSPASPPTSPGGKVPSRASSASSPPSPAANKDKDARKPSAAAARDKAKDGRSSVASPSSKDGRGSVASSASKDGRGSVASSRASNLSDTSDAALSDEVKLVSGPPKPKPQAAAPQGAGGGKAPASPAATKKPAASGERKSAASGDKKSASPKPKPKK